jgi:DNA-binding HxlR family transcriptional regulator
VDENEKRTGTQTLVLLSDPRNCLVLKALAEGPKRQVELRRETGFAAQSTLRSHLRDLEDIGAVAKRLRDQPPTVLEYQLEEPGRALLGVTDALERWLARAPDGPFELGSDASKVTTKALADAWSSAMLHTFAASPLSLTELDKAINTLNYPSLERRLAAMRLAGLVRPAPTSGRGTRYAVTDWMRHAVAPLVAAACWEQRHRLASAAPITPLDVEAAFLLAAPLVKLPDELSGSASLAVELPESSEGDSAGVVIEVQGGKVESCSAAAQETGCSSWVSGPLVGWSEAVIKGDPAALAIGGDRRFAVNLLQGLHDALFPD